MMRQALTSVARRAIDTGLPVNRLNWDCGHLCRLQHIWGYDASHTCSTTSTSTILSMNRTWLISTVLCTLRIIGTCCCAKKGTKIGTQYLSLHGPEGSPLWTAQFALWVRVSVA